MKEDRVLAGRSRVWVNETEVTDRCFEADEEKGFALCYVWDNNGFIHDYNYPTTSQGIPYERLSGGVRIEVAPG